MRRTAVGLMDRLGVRQTGCLCGFGDVTEGGGHPRDCRKPGCRQTWPDLSNVWAAPNHGARSPKFGTHRCPDRGCLVKGKRPKRKQRNPKPLKENKRVRRCEDGFAKQILEFLVQRNTKENQTQ